MGDVIWRKSSFSGGTTPNECVEVAALDSVIKIRESEDPGVVLTTTSGSLRGFIRAVKDGEFDRLG